MFVCPRCCYSTPFKQALLKHLAKLKACPAAKDNRSREEIINELTKKEYNEKTYDCQFCGKKFNSCSNKSRHLKVCKKKLVVDEKKATFDGNTESLIRENVELASKANESAILLEKLDKLKIENEKLTQQLKIEKEKVEHLKIENSYLKNNELFYQRIVEKYLNGGHKILEIGITDVTNETTHAGIKKWKYYKQAIGQLLSYNLCDKRQVLQIYAFGKTTQKEMNNAERIVKGHGIELYSFTFPVQDEVNIINHYSGEVVFKYKIISDN